MSDRPPAFQFYAKDWLDWKVLRMSDAAQGVYIRLLAHMWKDSKDQCSLPDDDKQIAAVLGKRKGTWQKLRAELMPNDDPLFHREGGRLISHRLRKERKQQEMHRKRLSEAGVSGAAKRWRGHRPGHSEAIARPMAPDSSSTSSSSSVQPPVAPPCKSAEPDAPQTGPGEPHGGCSSGRGDEGKNAPPARPLIPERDIPLAPAFKLAARRAGVDLGLVAQVIVDAKGCDLGRWYGWILVTEHDVRKRKGTPDEIVNPSGWYRRLCGVAELPEWAREESDSAVKRNGTKNLPRPVLDALRASVKGAGYKVQCPRCRVYYWTDEEHKCAKARKGAV